MRKRIVIIVIIVVLLALIGTSFYYWQYKIQNIREEVLNSLEENLEFCQIVKDDVSFNRGEFWLICNSRPFYAVYEKGKLNYSLNGWGFLEKQPEVLNDLRKDECSFYITTSDNTLIFVCKNAKAKKYSFSPSDFKLAKLDETLFVNLFSESPWYNYEMLTDISKFGLNNESFLGIKIQYKEHDAWFFFNLDKLYFTLPTVIDEGLSAADKANPSFQLINLCKKDSVEGVGLNGALLTMDCGSSGKPIINYDFNLGISNFLFPESEFEELFPYLAKYNFPFLEDLRIKYLRSEEDEFYKYSYYLVGSRVIIAKSFKNSGAVSEVYFKPANLQ